MTQSLHPRRGLLFKPIFKPLLVPAWRAAWLALAAAAVSAPTLAIAAGDLTSLSLEQLLDVNIVGASKYEQKQSQVAAAVSVITRQEIASFGWTTLGDALASLPGVYATYDRQYGYTATRGFGLPGDFNTRMLLTIDGNRVNDAVFDQGFTGHEFPLDTDLIERIEFIPGPGGAVYGQNAMFGVINVVTRSGASLGGTELVADYQGPQGLRDGRVSWGQRLGNGADVLLSASALRSRGEDRFVDFGSTGVAGVAAGLDGERASRFFARVAQGPWHFDLSYSNRVKDDPLGTYQSDPLTPGQNQRDRHLLAQLQYQHSFADDTLHLSARLFGGGARYTAPFTFGGAPTLQTGASNWHGAEVRAVSTAWARHKLMLGLEYQANSRQDESFTDYAVPAKNLDIRASGWRAGVYAQDEWALSETLSATLGLRLDGSNMTANGLNPRAGLIWNANPATTLKALYGRARRAPNSYERNYGDGVSQVANPALRGERIDTLELVADHRMNRDLLLRASVYRWNMRDLIVLGVDPASGVAQYQSGEAVRAGGLELSADQTWASGARLRGSLALQNARYASGRGLLNSPRLLGKLNLATPLPWAGLRAGYELRYDGQRLALDGRFLGGYAVSNLQLSTQALARGLELSLGLHNLLDKRYAHPGSDANWQNAIEQDGRSLRIKLSQQF